MSRTASPPPIRSIVKDADGKVGQVMDFLPTGAWEPTTAVLRPPGGGLEWRANLEDLTALPGWPVVADDTA